MDPDRSQLKEKFLNFGWLIGRVSDSIKTATIPLRDKTTALFGPNQKPLS